MLFYPFKPTPLLLIAIVTTSTWLSHTAIILFILQICVFAVFVPAFAKYLFLVIDSTIAGQTNPPPLRSSLFNPFTEWRHIHFMAGMCLLGSPLSLMQNQTAMVLYSFLIFITIPAYIGLLGGGRGLLAPLNPLKLVRFISIAGTSYWLLTIVFAGLMQLSKHLMFNSTYTFAAIFVAYYSLVFCAHAVGRLMYEYHQEMDIIEATGADLEYVREQQSQLKLRRQTLQQIYEQQQLNNVEQLINSHIEKYEADAFLAHRWFHEQMLQWEGKNCALLHGKAYVEFLRACGKTAAADLLTEQFKSIDPGFEPI